MSHAVMVAVVGLSVGGCGRLGDAMSGDPARDCHPDPETVAALRQEPVLTRTPPGAVPTSVTESVSCGWDGTHTPDLGMLEREIAGAGAAGDVSRFYADLARSSGWEAFDQPSHVYDANKSDGTACTWLLQVLSAAEGTYRVRITYTPRDLRPTCL
ncbi:hypothetical protein [Micromonospora sp. WMMD812]|uniref:hypothetical protein n=1 Tax=Micromonospora sp. WMMD812 TaxID=3015152 RepID=UPI00248C22CE|nr:hypothetical protein [Micromonospora sp. WMMD812]WBB70053.1 hypothetical protein O7603_12100 [Micromonospora sp. WMMD812]